jgi:hypothetical protein
VVRLGAAEGAGCEPAVVTRRGQGWSARVKGRRYSLRRALPVSGDPTVTARIPLLIALASLALVALPGTARADPASCAFDLDGFSAVYDCQVEGAGAAGTVQWCPTGLGVACAEVEVLSCYLDTTPPWFCSR